MSETSLRELTVEEKVGQLFFIGISGPQIDAVTSDLLSHVRPGGICLFARNIKSLPQTRHLLDSLRLALLREPFLSVDQEGGLVDRLRRVLAPMPAPAKLRTAEDAARLGELVARALRVLGFNMDFAPVIDVIDEHRSSANNGLLSRTFGKSEKDVVEFAGRFLNQLSAGGIMGCLKHFPGLGAAKVDSHEELPLVEIGRQELFERDLLPCKAIFEQVGDTVAAMVGHAAYPNIDLQETDQSGKLLPSSLSSSIVSDLLRNQLNFDGLVITDDLEMGAILKNYGIGEACVMAINAGVDMLAICADPHRIVEGYNSVLEAVKSRRIAVSRLETSIERIERSRKELKEPLPFDPKGLENIADEIAEFNSQLN